MSDLRREETLQRSGFQFDVWKWNFIASGGIVSFAIAQSNASYCAIVPWLSSMLYAYWLHQAEVIQGRRQKSGGARPIRAFSCFVIPGSFVLAPTLCVLLGVALPNVANAPTLTAGQYNAIGGGGVGFAVLLTAWFGWWWYREYFGRAAHPIEARVPANVIVELSGQDNIADVQTALEEALETCKGMIVKSNGVTRVELRLSENVANNDPQVP